MLIGRGKCLNIWIVDPEDHDYLVCLGSVGELLVEGPLVGGEYLNNPAKTAEAFVENPKRLVEGSPTHPGRPGRLYKTGDIVERELNGKIRCVTRKDGLMKIRGQRVELSEMWHWVMTCVPETQSGAAEVI
jgi:non-ribosomal peptide synthetase component F